MCCFFLPLRDILGKQKSCRDFPGEVSHQIVQVMRQLIVVFFVFFLVVLFFFAYHVAMIRTIERIFSLNEEGAWQLCLALLGCQISQRGLAENRADHYWTRVGIINFWQHKAKVGFWQHKIKWVKHKIKHKAAVIKSIKLSRVKFWPHKIEWNVYMYVCKQYSLGPHCCSWHKATQSKSNMNNFAKDDQTKYNCILNVKNYVTKNKRSTSLCCQILKECLNNNTFMR